MISFKIKEKINRKQTYIGTKEILSEFGYHKVGFNRYGIQRWILNDALKQYQQKYRKHTIKKTSKNFVLMSGKEIDYHWAINLRIFEDESFSPIGEIAIQNLKERSEYGRSYYIENERSCKKSRRRYKQTRKGKLVISRSNSHRRKLNFHPISEPLDCDFEWHHVNQNDVVAVPKKLHRKSHHTLGNGNKIEGIIG